MPSNGLESVRARLERAKRDLARAEGEVAAADKERAAERDRLCELLGCETGGEREAITKLEEEARAAEAEVGRLLDEAVRARDQGPVAP